MATVLQLRQPLLKAVNHTPLGPPQLHSTAVRTAENTRASMSAFRHLHALNTPATTKSGGIVPCNAALLCTTGPKGAEEDRDQPLLWLSSAYMCCYDSGGVSYGSES
eukprot:TRINITY_DN12066_c0_g1_i6.p1 TRINITY_DN12066_c0_g1~~TRINITY_DN12066_c0_g1_i6.p1  ORF type:complete len:107 (-),score=9.45 TRINITY_DN12066_c0_g1_i6:99-419(-)